MGLAQWMGRGARTFMSELLPGLFGHPPASSDPTPAAPRPTIKDSQPRVRFDCSKCPAFCCSVYERVQTNRRDVARLAKHFGLTFAQAQRRYTRVREGERVLKRVPDKVLGEACMFLDQTTRRCTIYDARPGTCRAYPETTRCAYYDLLQFERRQQDDDTVVPVVRITFQEWKRPNGSGR
jgi:Fe-S-cluster containining protein